MYHRHCPVCAQKRLVYAFSLKGYRICRCDNCSFMFTNPQPSDEVLAGIYNETYFIGSLAGESALARDLKRATARHYLEIMRGYAAAPLRGKLLEVGCGRGEFLVEASRLGLDVSGVEYSEASASVARTLLEGRGQVLTGEVDNVPLEEGSFDYCVFADVIEHVRDPAAFIQRIWRLLKPGGMVFIATPSLDSPIARLMRSNWMEFKLEHLSYFSRSTLDQLLHRNHFKQVQTGDGYKVLTIEYIRSHFARYPVGGLMAQFPRIASLLPESVRNRPRYFRASGIVACAVKDEARTLRTVSIVVPVYNEAGTVARLLEQLDAKRLDGLGKEVIVVESNSTDGSRELVRTYENRPGWTVILQERAQGKGHAVRQGLAAATGDYVMIQDADLEYDLEDYDVLLESLTSGRESFVLGARHGHRAWWKLRSFSDRPASALLLNFGHLLFATAINVLFGLRLRDPFTMYKVFRRDCLHGLSFDCNRFDFDYELLLKLVLRGHRPREIPVNYRSRSFSEGKKVAYIRDPLLWIRALYRLRFRTPASGLSAISRAARGETVAPDSAQ
jgi:glycosyltransferase involved in cell wall biosynthesis/SAM-dependent methyltransferase